MANKTDIISLQNAKIMSMVIHAVVQEPERDFSLKELAEKSHVPPIFLDEVMLAVMETMGLVTVRRVNDICDVVCYNQDLLTVSLADAAIIREGQIEREAEGEDDNKLKGDIGTGETMRKHFN